MKERKNILLFLGAIFSVFPLYISIVKLIANASKLVVMFQYMWQPATRNTAFVLIGNVVIYGFVIFLAVVQIVRNCRNVSGWALPVIGIAVSGVCLALSILTIPSKLPLFLIFDYLDLAAFRYIVNSLLINFGLVGMIGHILLLIGYARSLSKRK